MKRNRLIAAAAATALAVSLTACAGGNGAGGGTNDGNLDIGTLSRPLSLDPVEAIGSAVPFFQTVYDSLIKREPDGTFVPMLATEWAWNDDLTVLTMQLRDDVAFDDGSPFSAEVAKANLERFRDSSGPNASFLAGISVTTAGESTIEIALSEPDPAFLFYLSDSAGFMANPAAFEGDTLATTPDGTGPYTFNSTKSAFGTTWTYDQREDYWGDELDFTSITFQAFDSENAIVNGLRTGQIDTALLQDADQQIAAEQDSKLTIQEAVFDFQGLLLFDRDGVVTPALASPEVRQALNYAIDRESLLDVVRDGRGEVTSQVWGPGSAGYSEELDSYYSHDPAKAKELLAAGGYPDGFDLTLPKVDTLVSDGLATSVSADFAEIGVNVTWQDLDPATALAQIFRDKEFSAVIMNMGQSTDDWIVYNSLIAPGTFNFFGTVDPEISEWATEARAMDPADSASIYQSMNERIVEQAWFLPMYRLGYALVTVPGINAEQQSGMAVPSIYNYSLAE